MFKTSHRLWSSTDRIPHIPSSHPWVPSLPFKLKTYLLPCSTRKWNENSSSLYVWQSIRSLSPYPWGMRRRCRFPFYLTWAFIYKNTKEGQNTNKPSHSRLDSKLRRWWTDPGLRPRWNLNANRTKTRTTQNRQSLNLNTRQRGHDIRYCEHRHNSKQESQVTFTQMRPSTHVHALSLTQPIHSISLKP